MPINGTITLKMSEVQKKEPKGKSLADSVESTYKSLEKELKSVYPYTPMAKKMSYGSSGEAFGA